MKLSRADMLYHQFRIKLMQLASEHQATLLNFVKYSVTALMRV